MKDEQKHKIASNLYKIAVTIKSEVIIMKNPLLIGFALTVICLLAALLCDTVLDMYIQAEMWFYASFYVFFVPLIIGYAIRLKNWVLKWKEPIN